MKEIYKKSGIEFLYVKEFLYRLQNFIRNIYPAGEMGL